LFRLETKELNATPKFCNSFMAAHKLQL